MSSPLSLERLYAFIDDLAADLETLNSYDRDTTEVESASLQGISDACIELLGTGYDSEVVKRLNLPPKLVNVFVRNFGPVSIKDAAILGSKLLSYAKSLEGELALDDENEANIEAVKRRTPNVDDSSSTNLEIRAVKWIALPRTSQTKELIANISASLESIIVLSQSSNAPDSERVLSILERKQLIALLETTLAILKAPLIEKGLISRAGKSLGGVAEKVAAKQAEAALGSLASQAFKAIAELLKLVS